MHLPCPHDGSCLNIVLDRRLQRSRVRAHDLTDLVAVLEQQESGHGADGELLRHFGDLVDVELVEAGVGVVVGHPTETQPLGQLAVVLLGAGRG